jgi:hypothetical protein
MCSFIAIDFLLCSMVFSVLTTVHFFKALFNGHLKTGLVAQFLRAEVLRAAGHEFEPLQDRQFYVVALIETQPSSGAVQIKTYDSSYLKIS